MRPIAALILLAVCAACSDTPEQPRQATMSNEVAAPVAPSPAPAADSGSAPGAPAEPAGRWDMVSSGEGAGLFLVGPDDARALQLFCPAGDDRLVVNVPAFAAVASEERLSVGSGGVVVALVADPSGDAERGGVSGEAPVPAELAGILAGADGVAVNYGAQDAGPFPVVPADLARDFVAACGD